MWLYWEAFWAHWVVLFWKNNCLNGLERLKCDRWTRHLAPQFHVLEMFGCRSHATFIRFVHFSNVGMIHTPYFSEVKKQLSTLKIKYTVKLARAKLPSNAGNFTCSSQVKRSLAQFTCVTCSLPVKTSKFTCVDAASTSRRIHTNCLQAHVNLSEYHRHFTGSFTCGTHANLPTTSMQSCLLLQAKIHATYRQKH